jgi:hypothetical protein
MTFDEDFEPASWLAPAAGLQNPLGPRRRRGDRVGSLLADGGPGYTSGMKTAISLPDGIFEEAERLARRLKKSRSELYQEAVAEYVARHEPEAITEAMNELATQVDTRLDPFSSNATRRVLERSEW